MKLVDDRAPVGRYGGLKRALSRLLLTLSKRISRGRYDDWILEEIGNCRGPFLHLGCGSNSYQPAMHGREVRVDLEFGARPAILGDAHELPFPDGMFEVVLLEHMLHNCRSPQRVVEEAWRVLQVRGRLVAVVPFLFPVISPADRFRFTRFGIESLLGAFHSVRIQSQYGGYGTFAVLLARIGRDGGTVRYFSPFLLPVAMVLRWLDPMLSGLVPLRSFSSGFFVVAVK